MPVTIEFKLDASKAMRVIPSMLASVHGKLVDEMYRQTYRLQNIIVQKLSGPVLKNRTGLLRESINSRVTDDDNSIRGQVGTNVKYAAVHETGGSFVIPSHSAHWVHGPARGQARVQSWVVREHSAFFPQRSFIASTLREEGGGVIAAFKRVVADAAREAKAA